MGIPDEALILVAVINNPRDLEIARLLGWYRIPLRSAPKVIAVDYLAFYQTASFGEHGSMIEYSARITGHELVLRSELLTDQPNHQRANQEYYKVQISSLEPLPEPIPASKWKRVTFFYTTGEYLNRASVVDDLIVDTQDRQILWKSLRERVDSSTAYMASSEVLTDIPDKVLEQFLGIHDAIK